MKLAMNRRAWFFVSHLEEKKRPSIHKRYEIQVLNAAGQAVARGYVDDQSDNLEIEGQAIPHDVIKAAWRQPIGKGDYVDASGNSVPPF
jgi:hypothetical protein